MWSKINFITCINLRMYKCTHQHILVAFSHVTLTHMYVHARINHIPLCFFLHMQQPQQIKKATIAMMRRLPPPMVTPRINSKGRPGKTKIHMNKEREVIYLRYLDCLRVVTAVTRVLLGPPPSDVSACIMIS